MEAPKLFGGGGTQIDDLPSCLIIDILSRLPIETLVNSRFVCKSWFLLFSDPLFVRLHSARSPTCLLSRRSELKRDLKRYKSVGAMAGKDFEIDIKVRIPYSESRFWCTNSCHGLLCLSGGNSSLHEIYVCNPILGEYITIPIVNRNRFFLVYFRSGRFVHNSQAVLGFCSRSNRFKVLQIYNDTESAAYMAEIYTIGDGTGQWKCIGIPPRCTTLDIPDGSVSSFLNGSIHWADGETHQIVYFDFETEHFGSFPGPSAWRDGRWSEFDKVRVGVSDGCLCIYGCHNLELVESWVMKEYGVQESWTDIFSTLDHNSKLDILDCIFHPAWSITYSPSFISLQDVSKSEHLTVLSKTRTKDEDSPEGISNIIFHLWE